MPFRPLELELEIIAPLPPASKAGQIQEALAEVQALCEACTLHYQARVQDQEAVGQLLPIGGYYMGAMLPNQEEVDVVFVAPLTVPLVEMSKALAAEFGKRADAKRICPLARDGHLDAPGLRLVLRGVSVKLLLTQSIPGLPQPTEQSVVGNAAGLLVREACEALVKSVPAVDTFVPLLRFVKAWAKQRGVYGSYIGFLGGPAWAVCCAYVCQMHPYVELSQLVGRFFRIMSRWDWRQPVSLMQGAAAVTGGKFATAPSSEGMTVLLPAGPAGISCTPNVTETTAKITQRELRRGYKMVQQVELKRAPWSEVTARSNFFKRHRHYLQFDFMAVSEDILAAWLNWARTRMQDLVRLFETMSSSSVTLRPWPEMVSFRDGDWPYARALFLGLHLERSADDADAQGEGPRRSFDLREPIVKFLEDISTWPEAGRYTNQFELLIRHVRLAELEQWLEDPHRSPSTDGGFRVGAVS